jgi:dephospho-CoA kinase
LIVLGLTGSIGMGKTTAAATLRRLGVAVFDADRVVHHLLEPGGGAVERVSTAFSHVRGKSGGIDRGLLGQRVFGDPVELAQLESILHPMVAAAEKRFLARARVRRKPLAVLDIPLLFETGGERRCDYVLVVSAPAFIQRQRVLRRPGMTEIRLAAILEKQMPDREKRRRADFVLATGSGRHQTLRRLRAIVRLLRGKRSSIPSRGRARDRRRPRRW